MKIKTMTLAAALALGAATSAGTWAEDGPSREDLARQIVDRWSGHVRDTYPVGVAAWSAEMAPAFAEASLEELRAAAAATTGEPVGAARSTPVCIRVLPRVG